MAKFLVTRKRIVTQEVQFEMDAIDGQLPIETANAIDPETLLWLTVQEAQLSTDLTPIAEPEPAPEE